MSLFRPLLLRANFTTAFPRPPIRLRILSVREASSTRPENVILPRLPSDLKAAMRSKNKPALNAIRTLQAEIINASKTAKPIETDGALYALVQKQIKAIRTAMQEFEAAKREDLVQKEQEQLDVLQAYVDEFPRMTESEMDELVKSVVEQMGEGTKRVGEVIGRVLGKVQGRPCDVEHLRKKVEEAVEAKK